MIVFAPSEKVPTEPGVYVACFANRDPASAKQVVEVDDRQRVWQIGDDRYFTRDQFFWYGQLHL